MKNYCCKKKHYVVENISVIGNIIISCLRKIIPLTIEIFLLQKKILFCEENSCFREISFCSERTCVVGKEFLLKEKNFEWDNVFSVYS